VASPLMKMRFFPTLHAVCWSLTICGMAHAALVHDPSPPVQIDFGHTAPLASVAYSADGATIVSLATDREIRWRGAGSGKTLFIQTLPESASGLKVMPDGTFLTATDASVCWWEAPKANTAPTLRRKFVMPLVAIPATPVSSTTAIPNALHNFILAPDGKTLVTLTADRSPKRVGRKQTYRIYLHLWNAADATLIRALEPLTFERTTLSITFVDGGKTLVIAMPDHSVRWFDVATGAVQKEWKPAPELAIKPGDAAAAATAERELRQRQLPDRLRERAMKAEQDAVAEEKSTPTTPREPQFGLVLALSPDASRLVSYSPLGLRVWDLRTGTVQLLEKSERTSTTTPHFSPDGSRLATYGGPTLRVWDTSGKLRGQTARPQIDIAEIAFTPDSRSLAVAASDAQIQIWNMNQEFLPRPKLDPADPPQPQPETADVLAGFFQPIRRITPQADGIVAVTKQANAKVDAEGRIAWLPSEPIATAEAAPTTVQQALGLATASPDGTLLAETVYYSPYFSAMENNGIPKGELRIRDVKTNQVLWRESDKGFTPLTSFIWLPDNTLLLSKAELGRVSSYVEDSLMGLQRRDGRTGELATLDIDWTGKRGNEDESGVKSLAASADGSRLIVGRVNSVQLVDLKAGKLIRSFRFNQARTSNYAISPDGNWLAAGTGTNSINLWDLVRERKEDLDDNADIVLKSGLEEQFSLKSVSFGADGTLAAGTSNGRILAWKPQWVAEALPSWETAPTFSELLSLSFSTDGKYLWSGDARGELQKRDTATGEISVTIRLLPPKTEDAPAKWIKWDRAGKIVTSSPESTN
jgi:WD40 repeat protein